MPKTDIVNGSSLLETMRHLIDVVSNPLGPINSPEEYELCRKQLEALLSEGRVLKAIKEVRAGCKTNRFRGNIGSWRMKWLKDWAWRELGVSLRMVKWKKKRENNYVY